MSQQIPGRLLAACGVALALAALGGCGGPSVAPVSGVVTLDGKPYPNAVVSFQPIGSKDNPNPGRGSAGVTDEQGRFTLVYDGVKKGALVGRHRVRIFTQLGGEKGQDDGVVGPVKPVRYVERIPAEWHENSEKEFEVRRGGTDKADFAIVTKK